MGQCGCGEFVGGFRLPGPDGLTYFIRPYTGCEDCGAPPSVVIQRCTPAMVDSYDRETPEPAWCNYTPNSLDADAMMPVADMAKLAEFVERWRRLAQLVDSEEIDGDDDQIDAMEDMEPETWARMGKESATYLTRLYRGGIWFPDEK